MNQAFKNTGEQPSSNGLVPRDENIVLNEMKVCDKIYATALNEDAKIGACSALKNVKFLQAFQSLNLPGSSVLTLSNTDIVEQIIISVKASVELTKSGLGSPADTFKTLPAGWLWELIDNVQFTIGGSTSFQVSGQALLEAQMLSLENMNKRKVFLDLAGSSISVVPNTSYVVDAQLVLNVPALTKAPSYIAKSLPNDLRLLTNVSQVIVYWKDPSSVYKAKQTDVPGTTLKFTIQNNAFTEAKFIVVNATWTDPNLSLASVIKHDYMASYSHPFKFLQSFSVPLNGESLTSPITRTLSGFRYGAMRSILFKVYDPDLWNATNPMSSCEIKDFKLTFNGVPLYICDNRSLILIQACGNMDIPAVEQKLQNGQTMNNYLYQAVFSLDDPNLEESMIEDGIQIGNNSLTLTFTPDTSNMVGASNADKCGTLNSSTFGANAVLQICYVYNCATKVSQGGGRVDYVF